MLILLTEAAAFVVLIIFAINYGSIGTLWLLWIFAALDGMLMVVTIRHKLKKRAKAKSKKHDDKHANGLVSDLKNDKPKRGLFSFFKRRDKALTPVISYPDDKPMPHVDETFSMDGHQFEYYIAELYKRLGYKLISTKKSCDQGIDIIVKKIFKMGIQAKCYSRPVGNKAVQEAAAGKRFYHLHKVLVVTNGIFTDSAKDLAHKNKVTLIDRRLLAAMVKKANRKF